jgi:two-component system, NarL family, invasion response regulator UvrY
MIRVFLVDDHALVRTAFRMMLERETDMQVVGEAGSGEEAIAALRSCNPDVVISDLHLPAMGGLELTERLLRHAPAPRVVIVSMQKEGPMPRRLLEAGASGYLSKDCPGDELLTAVRNASRGKRYVGKDIAQQLALLGIDGDADASPFDLLSARELEIVTRLVRGQRMSDMARALNLSPKTVATHKYRLLAKLELSDMVALVRLAQQYGLLEPAT